MSEKLFNLNNPNADLFVIPTEEGANIEDDNRIASIGDATMKHISEIGSKRIILDHYIVMRDGNLFSIEDNTFWVDDDELRLSEEQDLDKLMKDGQIPEKYRPIYEEAIAEERAKRESSGDVMDNNGTLVPYSEWERMPGMMKHWNTPKTPKARMKYAGDCRQPFYDDFPTGHPDAELINRVLIALNRDIDKLTPKFVYAIHKNIENSNAKSQFTKDRLTQLVDDIVQNHNSDPNKLVSEALKDIDNSYRTWYSRTARLNELKTDPLYAKLVDIYKRLKQEEKRGTSRKIIMGNVKSLGKKLFDERKPFLEEGIDMSMSLRHWHVYHRIKKAFAPLIIVKGVNINNAARNEIAKVLNVSINTARTIIANGPFESLDEIRYRGYITYDQLIGNSDKLKEYTTIINTLTKSAKLNNNPNIITHAPREIIATNTRSYDKLSKEEFGKIWRYYNIKKTEVFRTLSRQ